MEISMIVVWLVLLLVSIIVEFLTTSLVSIWFAFGCLVAAVMALIGVPIFAQIISFAIVSILIMAVIRPIAKEYFNNKTIETNAGSVVGKHARVTGVIDNLLGTGTVVVEGMEAVEVKVYNTSGQMVKCVRETNEIDVEGLAEGVYLVRIMDAEGKVYTNKITVR